MFYLPPEVSWKNVFHKNTVFIIDNKSDPILEIANLQM